MEGIEAQRGYELGLVEPGFKTKSISSECWARANPFTISVLTQTLFRPWCLTGDRGDRGACALRKLAFQRREMDTEQVDTGNADGL